MFGFFRRKKPDPPAADPAADPVADPAADSTAAAGPDSTAATPAASPDGTLVQGTDSPQSAVRKAAEALVPEAPPGYELLGELGRGGMGVVYKARHVGLNRLCALKMILNEHVGRDGAIRFRHEAETVARLQRAVRPSAGYARSLGTLARAKLAGLTTKSGLIVGMGETVEEVDGVLVDLASLGVDIVTIGQYLRPTSNHLPVHRWVEPPEFDRWKALGESFGIGHVEASPLTRSSYHARQAADAVSVRFTARSTAD